VIPSIRFADLDAAVTFYVDTLGFEVLRGAAADGNVAVTRGAGRMMLEAAGDFYDPGYNDAIRERLGASSPHSLYVEVPELEEYYERLREAGVRIVDPIAPRPWGQVEFTAEDHAGNWLSFWAVRPAA
jgi:uncharacterized glyoxalase superfamily protein PhnB